jgi:hypothetical protein
MGIHYTYFRFPYYSYFFCNGGGGCFIDSM